MPAYKDGHFDIITLLPTPLHALEQGTRPKALVFFVFWERRRCSGRGIQLPFFLFQLRRSRVMVALPINISGRMFIRKVALAPKQEVWSIGNTIRTLVVSHHLYLGLLWDCSGSAVDSGDEMQSTAGWYEGMMECSVVVVVSMIR